MDTRLADTIAKLRNVSTATLCTALFKRGLRNQFIQDVRPLNAGLPNMVGPAFTLRYIPAREDLNTLSVFLDRGHPQRKAVEVCPPGAVMVIDSRKDARAASAGAILVSRLMMRGVAGVVTDGGFRDSPGIAGTGLPCFQRQPSGPATPIALHPVEFEAAVGCAGVAVYPGDVIVGDGEGVVVVPRHLADEVATEADDAAGYERFVAAHLARGRSIFGLFPATADSRAEYQRWVAAGRPPLE